MPSFLPFDYINKSAPSAQPSMKPQHHLITKMSVEAKANSLTQVSTTSTAYKPQQASVAQTSVEDVKNSPALTSTATTTYIIVAGVLLLAFAAIAYSILRRRVPVLEKVHPDGDSESPSRFLKNKVSPGDLLHSQEDGNGEGEFEGIENAAAGNRPERAAAAVGASSSSSITIIGETLYGYLVRTLTPLCPGRKVRRWPISK